MKTVDIQSIHRDRGALESALRQAGAVFKGKAIGCLWHEDKNPSGSVYQNEKGEWRFKCHACEVVKDVLDVQALMQGKTVDDLLRDMAKEDDPAPLPRVFESIEAMLESAGKMWTVDDHYRYTNPDTGDVEMVVIRCLDSNGKKNFIQARPERGGYVQKAPPKPWPIFNRTAVRSAETILLVEGEKCVKALRGAGWTATTSPAGAQNGDKADWTPLAGKNVVLWRDFDENGLKYINTVAEQLQRLDPAPKVSIIDVDEINLPEKSDCVDYLKEFGGETRESKFKAVETLVIGAQGTGPSAKVRKLINDTISGKRYAVIWPWRKLDEYTNALLPGTVTAICGDPAASKSFMLLHAAMYWHEGGIPFAMYQLESDEDGSHLLRALVQYSGCVDLLNWRWMKDNPDIATEIEERHREFIDSFGTHLWVPPAEPPNMEELTEWVRDRAKEGRRVIAIDPITAASASKQRWNDDQKFILNTQSIVREHGASLVIVTHPKLSAKDGVLADVAGGAAFTRFTQTVMWIKTHHPPKEFIVMDACGGEVSVMANRSIKITKARQGRGTNYELAFKFGNGLLFEECGLVSAKKPKNHDE